MHIEQAFGSVLRRQRVERGLTQSDLALRSRIAVSFVSRLERGLTCPTLETVFSLADALDVHPEELVKRARVALES